jgi:hypothetical protein
MSEKHSSRGGRRYVAWLVEVDRYFERKLEEVALLFGHVQLETPRDEEHHKSAPDTWES